MPGENRISELLNEKRYLKEIGEDFSHIDAEIFQITGRVLEADGGRIGYADAGVVSAGVGKNLAKGLGRLGLGAIGTPMLMYDAMAGTANEGEDEEMTLMNQVMREGNFSPNEIMKPMIEGEDGTMYSIMDLLEFGYTPQEIQEFI
tara:strand:+ start:79 stop:516 length:438 start_codon:yes stop_codon:yes gene_type:complete